jgi:hypothetical protein
MFVLCPSSDIRTDQAIFERLWRIIRCHSWLIRFLFASSEPLVSHDSELFSIAN